MAAQEPRLAWTLLRPRGASLSGPPPWPAVVTDHFGEVPLGAVPDVQWLLEGPLPVQVLSRVDSAAGGWVLSGLGRALGITIKVNEQGDADRPSPAKHLRNKAVAAMVGTDLAVGEDLADKLRALVEDEPNWEFVGVVEVFASLDEGATPDLPDESGWDDLSALIVGRGVGIGLGHVAWELAGWYSGATERGVMNRRVQVLLDGHLKKPSALLCYGAAAVSWGAVVRDATRRAAALESVLDEVRLAASWAISGGPAVDLDEARYVALAARLETLRVGLEEDLQRLRSWQQRLAHPTLRILGGQRKASPVGAFIEASPRSSELLADFEGRVQVAARWSEALHLAGKVIDQRG